MVAIGPITFSTNYSCSNTGNRKRTEIGIKQDDVTKLVRHEHLIYEEVVDRLGFLPKEKYNEFLDKAGLPHDDYRIKIRKNEQAVALIKGGATPQDLAEKFGCSIDRAKKFFYDNNLSCNKLELLCNRKDEIQSLINKRWSVKQLAEHFKVGINSMKKVLVWCDLLSYEQQQEEFYQSMKRSKFQELVDTFKTPEKIELGTNGLLSANRARELAKRWSMSFIK